MDNTIQIEGAKVHNLKNLDLEIPREKLVVITGLSGSGKSSLAFDTIHAEGQRRYMETFSAYIRQFVGNYGWNMANNKVVANFSKNCWGQFNNKIGRQPSRTSGWVCKYFPRTDKTTCSRIPSTWGHYSVN